MTFLIFSLTFGLLAVLHGVSDSRFKLCAFVVNGLIKGEIEKPSGQFIGLIVMSHWLGKVWIRIQNSLLFYIYPLFRVENHVCLSHGVQVAGAAWWAATRIVGGVGDLVQRTEDDCTGRVLGGRMIREVGWRLVRSIPCTWRWGAWVSWLSLKIKFDGLWVVWPQNQVMLWFPSLTSRLAGHDGRWCTWHHHRGYVRIRLKADESMWRTTSDSTTLTLPFSMY
jgi:hypothetical protein